MIKFKQRITNPMTVIAIFATLSETSAAISLPFLDNEDREIYIWFLISFPFYLLFLFFLTLNFNYRSLYAPSDFEKEKHFITAMEATENAGKQKQQGRGKQSSFTAQHYIRLPVALKDMHIIDARWMDKKIDVRTLLEKRREASGNAAQVIVFLIVAESEKALKGWMLKNSKNAKKYSDSTLCIAYNLNSRGMTIMNQTGQIDPQSSAVAQD